MVMPAAPGAFTTIMFGLPGRWFGKYLMNSRATWS